MCAGTLPFISCKAIKINQPSSVNGVYSIDPDGAGGNNSYNVLCDMTTDGGGWTLVWSTLMGKTGDLQENMTYVTATTTLPVFNGTINTNKETFEVYTGLDEWNKIGGNAQMDIMYEWRYTNGATVSQEFKAKLNPFTSASYYTINMSSYTQLVGSTTAGFYSYNNGMKFTSIDNDHDLSGANCSTSFSNTPWWYGACWDGSLNGGGAFPVYYYNGAYWSGYAPSWGSVGGTGAGNGWIWIR